MSGAPRKTVLYSTAWCPYCARLRSLLEARGCEYEEIDIDAAPERRREMIARSGRHTVPQLFVDERHLGGCDDVLALEATGELDRLLGKAKVNS